MRATCSSGVTPAGGAFIAALARGRITRTTLLQVMGETTAITALIYMIIIGVLTFSFAMGVTGLPQQMTEYVSGLHLAPVIILTIILLVYPALGCIMDSNTVMFVTIPIVTPLITGMGYDLVWWGIINLVVLETGLITPPFGLHLFVLKSIAGGDVPSPADIPAGCRFHTRCAFVIDRCRTEDPALHMIEDNHLSACHRAEELPAAAAMETVQVAAPAAERRLALYADRRAAAQQAGA